MLSGAFGAGGGVVSTPAIRLLGATPLDSVGSTLPPILPSAIAGGLRYHRMGFIRWEAVRILILTGIPSAVLFAWLGHRIPGEGHLLMLLTAVLVIITGYRMLTQTGSAPDLTVTAEINPAAALKDDDAVESINPPIRAPHERSVPVWVGACAGGLSGLLGIGGGVVMVPVLVNRMRMPIKSALGTSLVSAGCYAIPATITHALLGGIDWSYSLPLALGVIPGSWIGSAIALRANERRLRIAVSLFLMTVAVVLIVKEIIDWS